MKCHEKDIMFALMRMVNSCVVMYFIAVSFYKCEMSSI